jgi:hypothetical protein
MNPDLLSHYFVYDYAGVAEKRGAEPVILALGEAHVKQMTTFG